MTVSPFQPPPASIAARCQMPQVPLKGSGWPAQQRVACSMPRWASSVTICISVSAFSCGLRKSKRACTNAVLRLGEERPHAAAQEIRRRHVVDVEDGEVVVGRLLHRLVQRAALVAAAIGALQGHDIEALRAQLGRDRAGKLGGLVGAVVEQLDVQLVARPVEAGRRLDAAPQDGALVEGRDLHHDVRQLGVRRQRRGQQLSVRARGPSAFRR